MNHHVMELVLHCLVLSEYRVDTNNNKKKKEDEERRN